MNKSPLYQRAEAASIFAKTSTPVDLTGYQRAFIAPETLFLLPYNR
ncbi:MAG: hypothetical protein QX189_02445 [Methylococcales bacterium]